MAERETERETEGETERERTDPFEIAKRLHVDITIHSNYFIISADYMFALVYD